MTPETGQKFVYLICFVVVTTAVVGYFVGLQSPMNPVDPGWGDRGSARASSGAAEHHTGTDLDRTASHARSDGAALDGASLDDRSDGASGSRGVILATHYSQMHKATEKQQQVYRTSLANLNRNFDPLAEVIITPEQKSFALALREQNRAFNGAPPTIPHAIEQMSAKSCMACHGEGFKSESLRISKMSHQFLANCTQCHVENNPSHMAATLFRDNSFAGLPAPEGGPRAYEGAPPMIPHSTWMRVNCMSCHGFSSQQGIRTTHPWRQNCQQCHAPSSKLDQVFPETEPKFLPPPNVSTEN